MSRWEQVSGYRQLIRGLESPRLTDAFQRRLPGSGAGREAAVLILLGDPQAAGGPDLLYIERAATLRHHAGQIAFPGGAVEPDETPQQAALREADEEVGLDPATVSVLGELPTAQVPVSAYRVHSIVGTAPDGPLRLQPGEVAAVHRIPIAALADPTNRTSWRHWSGHTGPGFSVGDLYIWGFTAYVTDALLAAGGWEQPWDQTRFAPIPRRFGSDVDRPPG